MMKFIYDYYNFKFLKNGISVLKTQNSPIIPQPKNLWVLTLLTWLCIFFYSFCLSTYWVLTSLGLFYTYSYIYNLKLLNMTLHVYLFTVA